MKKNYFLIIALLITTLSFGQVQITEIHYSDQGPDSNEGVEIAASVTTDLSGWSILLYDANGNHYGTATPALSGTLNAGNYNWIDFAGGTSPYYAINNTGGVALVNGSIVIQFISYGGAITAIDGLASGVTSIDIGVTETNSTPDGTSIQLTDAGWVTGLAWTPYAQPTDGLTLSVAKNQIAGFAMYPNPVTNGTFSITSNNSIEKNIEIFSVSGQQVYKSSVKSRENIDISNLTTGSYFIRVEEEGKTATRKLIVN